MAARKLRIGVKADNNELVEELKLIRAKIDSLLTSLESGPICSLQTADQAPIQQEGITIEILRELCGKKVKTHGMDEVKALLAKFSTDGSFLSKVPEDKYGELKTELEAL
jgi:hypothetical protein